MLKSSFELPSRYDTNDQAFVDNNAALGRMVPRRIYVNHRELVKNEKPIPTFVLEYREEYNFNMRELLRGLQ